LAGVASFLLPNILDPQWGIVLLVLGVLNFIIIHRAVFVLNG
jgi:hypothetical protein